MFIVQDLQFTQEQIVDTMKQSTTTTTAINCEYFVAKKIPYNEFCAKKFLDKQSHTALALTMCIFFHVFNFCIAHAIQKYFNNENFTIYGMSLMESSIYTTTMEVTHSWYVLFIVYACTVHV